MKNKIQNVKIGVKAQQQFEKLRQEVEDFSGSNSADKFVNEFDKVKNQLKKTPEMFEESRVKPGARRALFFNNSKAFLYKVYTNLIRIVAVFDTRTNKYH